MSLTPSETPKPPFLTWMMPIFFSDLLVNGRFCIRRHTHTADEIQQTATTLTRTPPTQGWGWGGGVEVNWVYINGDEGSNTGDLFG